MIIIIYKKILTQHRGSRLNNVQEKSSLGVLDYFRGFLLECSFRARISGFSKKISLAFYTSPFSVFDYVVHTFASALCLFLIEASSSCSECCRQSSCRLSFNWRGLWKFLGRQNFFLGGYQNKISRRCKANSQKGHPTYVHPLKPLSPKPPKSFNLGTNANF